MIRAPTKNAWTVVKNITTPGQIVVYFTRLK